MRTIPLGDLAMEGVRLARKHYNERKMRSRPLFVDSGFVFIDEVGRALHPNALYGRVQTRLRQTSKSKSVYGHVLKGRKEEAIRSIDEALGRNKTSTSVMKRRGQIGRG